MPKKQGQEDAKRKANFTQEATDIFVEQVAEKKHILFEKCSPSLTASMKKKCWEDIAAVVNACTGSKERSAENSCLRAWPS